MIANRNHLEGLTSEECQQIETYLATLQHINPKADISSYPQTPLTARYNLNRIRHNDPTITVFHVNMMNEDPGLSGNEMAEELTRALKSNTHVNQIGITYTPLRDEALEPLLSLLKDRPLRCLDFSGTDITDKTIAPMILRFADTHQPRWEQLVLKHVIAGYAGQEAADIAHTGIWENVTRQQLFFEPETPMERNRRMSRFIISRPFYRIPPQITRPIREKE